MKKVLFFLLMLPVFLQGKWTITLYLDKVIKEPDLKTFLPIENKCEFQNEFFRIVWKPRPDGFNFELINKADVSIAVVWNECVFINFDGETGRVMHGGIRFVERDQPMPDSIVPVFAKITDNVLPVELIHSHTYGWGIHDIYQENYKDKEYEKIKNEEWTFRVILVIKKGESKQTYHFFFKPIARKTG